MKTAKLNKETINAITEKVRNELMSEKHARQEAGPAACKKDPDYKTLRQLIKERDILNKRIEALEKPLESKHWVSILSDGEINQTYKGSPDTKQIKNEIILRNQTDDLSASQMIVEIKQYFKDLYEI